MPLPPFSVPSLRARPALRCALALLLCALAACGSPDDTLDPGTPGGAPTSAGQAAQPGTGGAAPDAGSGSAATSPGSPGAVSAAAPAGSLVKRLQAQPMAASGSEGWLAPTALQLHAFAQALAALLDAPGSAQARQELAQLGFSTADFRDSASGTPLLLVEDAAQARGAGTVVLNLAPARDLWLEAPHATSDTGTGDEAARLLVSLGARALVVTGADRCASAALTPCTAGATSACGGQLRVSDAAHYTENFFTAAHRALRAALPHTPALSVHGFVTGGTEAAVVSDGTRASAAPGALTLRVRDALNHRLPQGRATSCNDPADTAYRPLCATTNVQGRIDNGAADACLQGAGSASGLFLHVEQAPALRRAGASEDAVEAALMDSFTCSLPGPARGCGA
ncbi:hypothetical protein FGE12_26230 [Aggregicoccus sp. 17bor-14]|uniref:hypothetical protein n=1 Tax=Myxococcaceae TaxID=31 RepID=UPI00129D0679|nr:MULTISPECIES: hypothetical protein [Myxococcaceae]MBF5045937.1 hypothetical protein [Simulacricoccus sp. 17bor-14]MRI91669.1 hypothetical protein [Aggregicoccus sp. 17bor-14]